MGSCRYLRCLMKIPLLAHEGIIIFQLVYALPIHTPENVTKNLKYPSNPQKPVQSLAICTKKRKKPLLIHCHIRKTPYLCTRFPKGST